MPRPDLRSVLLPTVLLALFAMPAMSALGESHDDEARRSLEQTEQALKQERRREREAREAHAGVVAELDRLRAQLIEAAGRLQDEEAALAEAERRLAELAAAERETLEALRREHRELGASLTSLSRLARRSPTALLAGTGKPLDSYRGIRLVAAVSRGLEARTKELKGELATLGRLRRSIAAEEAQRRRRAAEMADRRRELVRLVDEKAALEGQLESARRAAAERAARLAREAEDLRELLAKLAEAEERRRREAAERAAAERRAELARLAEQARQKTERERLIEQAPPLPEHKPAPAETTTAAAAPAPTARQRLSSFSSFSEARGKLPMPARGRIVEAFGQRNGMIPPTRGIRIETLDQAQVISPFDGEVVFAGDFRRYGLLLIISLGEGYHILLSGMARLYGVVGQQVLAGEPVGEMGSVAAGQPRLYVELRRKGEPINPLPWLSAAKGKISG